MPPASPAAGSSSLTAQLQLGHEYRLGLYLHLVGSQQQHPDDVAGQRLRQLVHDELLDDYRQHPWWQLLGEHPQTAKLQRQLGVERQYIDRRKRRSAVDGRERRHYFRRDLDRRQRQGTYDLIVHQYNSGGLTISAGIGNNGANAVNLVKDGTSYLWSLRHNTYTGNTYVNGGILDFTSTTPAR